MRLECTITPDLVDVDIKNEIRMHDHLTDLGRNLAKDPGLPCRLWHWTENIDDLLEQSSAPLQLRELQIASPLVSDIPNSIGLLKHLEEIVLSCLYLEKFYDLILLKHLTIKSYGIGSQVL